MIFTSNQFFKVTCSLEKYFVKSLSDVISQCGKTRNSLSHFFDKNFVKVTFLLNKLNMTEDFSLKALV